MDRIGPGFLKLKKHDPKGYHLQISDCVEANDEGGMGYDPEPWFCGELRQPSGSIFAQHGLWTSLSL